QSLDAQSRLSQGLASVTKRDFFKNFYSAFDRAFTEANISSSWQKDRERGHHEALDNEKKKRKRGQPFTEELRAEEGVGVLFFSPSKVQKARELQDAKEAAKEREAHEKVSRAEARAALKAQKGLEAQQKREDRAMRAEARKAEDALKKARREQAKEARKAQKQLETESKASQKRSRANQGNGLSSAKVKEWARMLLLGGYHPLLHSPAALLARVLSPQGLRVLRLNRTRQLMSRLRNLRNLRSVSASANGLQQGQMSQEAFMIVGGNQSSKDREAASQPPYATAEDVVQQDYQFQSRLSPYVVNCQRTVLSEGIVTNLDHPSS
ncbi:hypothetical protein LTS01_025641, partial [Friedmanniomyces endolithicus]